MCLQVLRLATLILLSVFILIPIVKISGNMGSFMSTSVALDIIQDLHRNLRSLKPDGPQLFPPLRLVPHLNWDHSRQSPPAR